MINENIPTKYSYVDSGGIINKNISTKYSYVNSGTSEIINENRSGNILKQIQGLTK